MTAAQSPDPAAALAAHLLDNPGDRLPGTIDHVLSGAADLVAAESPELATFLADTAAAVREAADLMTAGGVARLLGIHVTEVSEWERLGRLHATVIPGGWHRYAGAEVRALLAGGVR